MLFDTSAVKRGSLNLAVRTGTTSSSFRTPSSCHPACLLFTITSEQDNRRLKDSTVANHVSHPRMLQGKFSSTTPTKSWWSQTGSNRRPQACKASALPTELWPRSISAKRSSEELVGLSGLEPLTSRLSGVCSNHLSYRPSEDRRSPSVLTDRFAQGGRSDLNLPNILRKKEKRSRRLGRWTYRIP
jgi:hypothetical protein